MADHSASLCDLVMLCIGKQFLVFDPKMAANACDQTRQIYARPLQPHLPIIRLALLFERLFNKLVAS